MSKNIIITGTSSGIGFELVNIFSKKNHRVLALSRDNSKLRELKLDGVDAIDFDLNHNDYGKINEFLKKAEKTVSINELQTQVWGHSSKLDTHTVETHIYRLRKKISNKFNNDNFIKSKKSGYTIE